MKRMIFLSQIHLFLLLWILSVQNVYYQQSYVQNFQENINQSNNVEKIYSCSV